MDSDHENPLFRAPVKDPKNILDLGTGLGNWAMYVERKEKKTPFIFTKNHHLPSSSDVADMFPTSKSKIPIQFTHINKRNTATVRGVDLFPPPVTWMPPNCILEVDNIAEEWTWNEPQDLIHMRIMIGAFDDAEWKRVYQQCYE